MSDPTNDRKVQHIRIIEADRETDRQAHHFDAVQLRNRALPEVRLSEVDPSIIFLNKTLSFPLLISSMTGGDHELTRTINRNLARAAEECRVGLAVGSQRVMFTNPDAADSFALRADAPTTLLFANLGGVQLNYGFGLEEARQAVETVGADGLYFHLNALQEAVQPEGDTDFNDLASKMGELAAELKVPVLLKEVGAGLSEADVELGIRHGIRYFDVAGHGGTSWSRIEHHRQEAEAGNTLGLTFQDWGIPTPEALRRCAPYREHATLLASGGIRNGLDMAKAMVLGASLCGIAAPFLEPAMESTEAVVQTIQRLKAEFTTAMFLLGCGKVDQLQGHEEHLL